MPNGVAYEVFVIAVKRADGTLPLESKIYDERFFMSREDAVEALDDFQPYMRDSFEVYAAHVHIAGVSHDTPFVMPTDDEESEDGTEEAAEEGLSTNDRVAIYSTCRQAIVDYCTNNRTALDAEFTNPLTDAEFAEACDLSNWLTNSEVDSDIDPSFDYDATLGYGFDCGPFDDQLRAYVQVDDTGAVTKVVVQGE